MSDVAQIYPFSSEKGDAIPLDIMEPLASIAVQLAVNAAASLTIPSTYKLVAIYSAIDVFVDFTDAQTYPVTLNTSVNQMLFVPAQSVMTIKLPDTGAVKLIPANANEGGLVVFTDIRKWAAIALERQLTRY